MNNIARKAAAPATAIAALTLLTACAASNPTLGERLSADAATRTELAEQALEGERLIERGERLVRRGQERVQDGEDQVREGRDLIERGERLLRETRRAVDEDGSV